MDSSLATSTLSLVGVALNKVAVSLWTQEDIKLLISTYSIEFGEWQEIASQVKQKAAHLSLPEELRKKLFGWVQRTGFEIRHWVISHGENIDVDESFILELSDQLCWTTHGTVDRRKTAEQLARDENLDLGFRYRLSCFYCLEEDVLRLWAQMGPDERSYENDLCDLNMYERRLTTFWTYHLRGQPQKLQYDIKRYDPENTPYEYAFQCAAQHVNETAMSYFWQRMTDVQREKHIQMAQDTGVVCFLFSEMSPEQRLNVFKSWPFKVLDSLLFWPRLDLFIDAAKSMWNYLSESEYSQLFLSMTTGCSYVFETFELFWKEAPISYRKYVINDRSRISVLLERLLKSEDEDNLKMIMNEATVEEKENVIFDITGICLCVSLIIKGRWNMLRFFAGECLTSKFAVQQLDEDLEDHFTLEPRSYNSEAIQKWKEYKPKFIHFLNNKLDN